MNKKDKINQIISRIKTQAEEISDSENTEMLTAEEIVVIATELTTFLPVSTIKYSSPIGTVDRTKVTFMLGDEIEFPLFGDEYYETEPDI